jgi:hypothetical protein
MNTALMTVPDMEKMAIAIAKSNLFGMKKPEEVMALMAISQAEGRHPALAARDYDIIQGKPSKKSEAMMRDFLTNQGKITWHTLSDTIADATFSHPAGGEVRITWDLERAKIAGLGGKDMWKKYPRQMLRARVISEGVRTVCPMATSGMYVPEEVRDFAPEPKERDVTPEVTDVTPEEKTVTPIEPEVLEPEHPTLLDCPALVEKMRSSENYFNSRRGGRSIQKTIRR